MRGVILGQFASVRQQFGRRRHVPGAEVTLSAQALTGGRENQLSDTEPDHGRDESTRSLIDTRGQALEQGPVVFVRRPADELTSRWNSGSALP